MEQLNNKDIKGTAQGRPKSNREIKKRVTLSVLPSLYEEVQKIAYVERKSVSEIVAELMAYYVTRNSDKLAEYDAARRGGNDHGV